MDGGNKMPNLHNEEIRAIQHTVVALKKGVALEQSQSKRDKMKKDIKELESLIETKLMETPDFANIRIEEDIY